MSTAASNLPPLPAPTRAKRPDAPTKSGPPFKLFIVGAILFLMLCAVLMGVGLFFGVQTAKEYGYDPELGKKYPVLAGFVMGMKNTQLVEDLQIDRENGIVTYRDKRTGRKIKIQEIDGHLQTEIISVESAPESNGVKETPKKKPLIRKKPAEKEILDNKF